MSKVHEVNPHITAMVQDYGNCQTDFVINTVTNPILIPRRNYSWRQFDKVAPFNALADDSVGCYSQVKEVMPHTSQLVPGIALDHGIETPVCWDDLNEAGQACAGLEQDILARTGRYLASKVMLGAETELVGKTMDETLYPAANQHDQSGANLSTLDPVELFNDIMGSATLQHINGIAMSKKAWSIIRRHPSILGSSFSRGISSVDDFAGLFGFDFVAIGMSYANDASNNRVSVWPDDKILLFHRNTGFNSTTCPEATFAFTARLEQGMVGFSMQDTDRTIGLRGGVRVRVGEGRDIQVADYDLGQIIYNFVAA